MEKSYVGFNNWLKNVAGMMEVGRLQSPRLVAETGELSVVAEVPPTEVAKGEAASGESGLFLRRFVESEEDRALQRVVPLDLRHDRLAALRIAKSLQGVAVPVNLCQNDLELNGQNPGTCQTFCGHEAIRLVR